MHTVSLHRHCASLDDFATQLNSELLTRYFLLQQLLMLYGTLIVYSLLLYIYVIICKELCLYVICCHERQ